jgi:hypothetical protein
LKPKAVTYFIREAANYLTFISVFETSLKIWPPINKVSAFNTIIKTLASGCKLGNENCWRLESEHGWTQCLEISTSSHTHRLDIDGWEIWIGSSDNCNNNNSQSSGFCKVVLSTTRTKEINNSN